MDAAEREKCDDSMDGDGFETIVGESDVRSVCWQKMSSMATSPNASRAPRQAVYPRRLRRLACSQ
eukprot:1296258-Pyramimonas_sp.AAC.1